MRKNKKFSRWLTIFLWFIAIHSFVIGILLIFLPASAFHFFGFNISVKFFTIQSGVFHILMAVAYSIAAYHLSKAELLIKFIIIVKITASIFLFIYYFLDNNIIILLSGIGDFLMAIIVLFLYLLSRNIKNIYKKNITKQNNEK